VTCKVSNKEILSLCFRFVDLITSEKPIIREMFFELADAPRTTGHHLGQNILSILETHNRDLSYYVWQCYDGASSANIGCQAEVRAKASLALYQHHFSQS
jgi:hypothetical protein